MKRLAYVGASLLLALSVSTACSDDKDGDDKERKAATAADAPDDAATDDFCDAMTDLTTGAQGDDEKPFRDALAAFVSTGTPVEIKGDSRKGYELFAEALGGVEWEQRNDVAELPQDDQKLVAAFITDYSKLCVTPDATPTPAE